MIRNNKKAISAVIATVLIILITVAAITIIWAAIIPLINKQLSSGTNCLDAVAQVQIVSDEGYTCKNLTATTKYLQLQISHGAKDFTLADVQVLVSSGGVTKTLTLMNNATGTVVLPDANEAKVYTLNIADTTFLTNADKVEIAPVISVGNTQDTCEISSSAVINNC